MQDKHVVIVRADEDRDIFINKVKYPKTVYQVEGKGQPEEGDIVFNGKRGFPATMATWILENWNNLPDFVIFCQANPDDHVADMVSALDVTLTANFGSYSFARAVHNQYTTNWVMCLPLLDFLKELDINLHNANNQSYFMFFFYPGDHFYISKKLILEKSKKFFEKIIELDSQEKYFEIYNSFKKPPHFNLSLYSFHPEWKNLSIEQRYDNISKLNYQKNYGNFGLACEIIFPFLFADKPLLKLLEKSQAILWNQLYFNLNSSHYDSNFHFSIFPFSHNILKTRDNMLLLENIWFDYNCPYYKKWRQKICEKVTKEKKDNGESLELILKYNEKIGYKHISL